MMRIRNFIVTLCIGNCLHATPIAWVAPSPNNDVEDTGNWNPSTVPGSGDSAVFNSALTGVSTNPTESSNTFSVSSFNFTNLASPFTFSFDNQRLAFSGAGITGAQTNPTLSLINTNNSTPLGDALSFAAAGTTGSAHITITNSASLSGPQSAQSIGIVDSQLHSVGAYDIADGGTIAASNTGHDSTTASGGNSIAIGTTAQLKFDDSFTIGNNVTVSAANSGTFDGSSTTNPDFVGLIQDNQLRVTGACNIGNDVTITVANNGDDSNTGVGNSQVGVINAAQMALQTATTVGNDVSIAVTNAGINASSTTVALDQTAYLNDNQLFIAQSLQAGDRFNLTVSNSGNDSSTGVGQHQVAVINSNSGTTGDQLLLAQGATLNGNGTINVTNSGTYTGTNTAGGSQVGGMNQGQCAIGDSTSIGSYNFSAHDQFTLTVSNNGTDSAQGMGADAVGAISTNQTVFFTPCSLGNQAHLSISNEGTYTGSASTTYVNVGSVGSHQLMAASTFHAGDDFVLNITNAGSNTGSGIGNFFIGDVSNAQQADFEHGLTIGDNGSVTITNSGSNTASTTNHNQVGSMMGYGVQLLVKEGLQTGDNLAITIHNTGSDNSTGSGGNLVGFMNNNTGDFSASQLHLSDGATIGNNATITLSNIGTFAADNTGNNAIATLGGPQCASMAPFQAGDGLSLQVSMMGTNNGSGQNNNSIALLGGSGSSQIDFQNDCTVGKNASFVISNNGINNDFSGTDNLIGYITNAQMNVVGDFSAGTDLNITINNSAANAGHSSNVVGYIAGSQLAFQQGCTVGNRSAIAVTNGGTVDGSQIVFNQGFDILSGKATISVTNNGTVGDHGIEINGNNAGGNADIVLNNSSLYVATSLADFTIASLSGDASSIAQSQPTLIINRDSAAQTDFAGSIQDFSGMVPTALIKSGAGTQLLSGENSYTGLTSVQEGTLVVNGSLAGDVHVDAAGALKGSGTINGTLTNAGTINPGQSIGTLTVGNYINNGANYEVELNSAGQSDLIHALGTATINGGTVIVMPQDFNFTAPVTYTIITADAGVSGQFSALTSTVPSLLRLIYNSLNVQLSYLPLISDTGLSCNALNAARCFVTLTNADAIAINNTILGLSLDVINNAFEQMSPLQFSGLTNVQLLDAVLVRSTYSRHMQEGAPDDAQLSQQPINVWTDGFVQWQHQGAWLGYNDRTVGATLGIDYSQRHWTIGTAFSVTNDHVHWQNCEGTGHTNSYYGGLYGKWNDHHCYIDAAFIGAFNTYKTTRYINFATIDRNACAHHNGNEWLIHAGFEYEASWSDYQLAPYFNLDYVFQHEHNYTESGAGSLNLHIQSDDSMLLQTEVGLAFSATYRIHKNVITPSFALGYINQTPCSSRNTHAQFINSSCVFTARGAGSKQNLFAPSLAFTYQNAHDNVKSSLYYDAQVGSHYWSHGLMFDIAFCF